MIKENNINKFCIKIKNNLKTKYKNMHKKFKINNSKLNKSLNLLL